MINGGVKSNALPEQAHVVVNHRILTQSSVAETQAIDTSRLLPIAARHNLTVEAFGKTIVDAPTAYGHLNLSVAFGHALNPAPGSHAMPQPASPGRPAAPPPRPPGRLRRWRRWLIALGLLVMHFLLLVPMLELVAPERGSTR